MSFLKQIEGLILDMDGVLWRGETPMPGLQQFFETLDRLGINYVLATNNATRVATQYTDKLARFGVNVTPEHILTSSEATAGYLREEGHYPAGTLAYVVGESGLQQAMRERGFNLLEAEAFVGEEARADLVVVGFTRHFCYPQLASAAYLISKGAAFVGTNPDLTFPTEIGPLPGAGSLLAFIKAATGVEPLVIGKPGRAIFQEAIERLGSPPEKVAMVGDRLETDIQGAQSAALYTVLLLSGVTRRQKLEASSIQPDLVCADIGELAEELKRVRL